MELWLTPKWLSMPRYRGLVDVKSMARLASGDTIASDPQKGDKSNNSTVTGYPKSTCGDNIGLIPFFMHVTQYLA
jgi:hypothetical protein